MHKNKMETYLRPAFAVGAILLLTACGGGGAGGSAGGSTSGGSSSSGAPPTLQEPAVAATDAFNRLSELRQQSGSPPVQRNNIIDGVATQHSRYTVYNNDTGHDETLGLPYFTGTDVQQRLNALVPKLCDIYCLEVFSSGGNSDGARAVNDLFAAIYHRFGMLSPFVSQVGVGAVTGLNSGVAFTTQFTLDFTATASSTINPSTLYIYPYNGQTDAPRDFFSNFEIPDPVPPKDRVGYPISIQVPEFCDAQLLPTSFTLNEVKADNTRLPVKSYFLGATAAPNDPNLTDLTDPPASQNYPNPPKTTMQQRLNALALIPELPLQLSTTYEVSFVGTVVKYATTGLCVIPPNPTIVSSAPINTTWTFTTRSF